MEEEIDQEEAPTVKGCRRKGMPLVDLDETLARALGATLIRLPSGHVVGTTPGTALLRSRVMRILHPRTKRAKKTAPTVKDPNGVVADAPLEEVTTGPAF